MLSVDDNSPEKILEINIDGSIVTIKFSINDTYAIKDKIIDILTASYEKRLQDDFISKM